MGQIYKNAVLTISTDAAEDCSVSIVNGSSYTRTTRTSSMPRTKFHSESLALQGTISIGHNHENDYEPGLLSRRGWILQEEALSPKILQFSKTLIFWRCLEMRVNDAFLMFFPLLVDSKLLTFAQTISQTYNPCHCLLVQATCQSLCYA
jgi:hypothetical protein